MAGLLPGELVDVLDGTLGDELRFAPDLDKARCLLGVDDEQADLRVGEQVAALLALERRVDPGAFVVDVDPRGVGDGR